MKRFEFRLNRVLEYRQEEAGLEQTRLGSLVSQEKSLEEEKAFLRNQLVEARDEAIADSQLSGSTLETLAQFNRHVNDRSAQLDRDKAELQSRIREQRLRVLEAERRVNLLLKLKEGKHKAWTLEQDRELEALAADSHMAKLAAQRRLVNNDQNKLAALNQALTAV